MIHLDSNLFDIRIAAAEAIDKFEHKSEPILSNYVCMIIVWNYTIQFNYIGVSQC